MRAFKKVSDKEAKKRGVDIEAVRLPRRASPASCAYDLYSPKEIKLAPGDHSLIPLGLKAYMEEGEVLIINGRSGQGVKGGLRLRNVQGWIDGDYVDNPENEGHIMVCLQNDGHKPLHIHKGQALAQALFTTYLTTDDDCPIKKERAGGFGSTDPSL